FAEGTLDRFSDLAADLVRLKVDIILTVSTPAAQAAKKATQTITIVMASSSDPITGGLVHSLARPGGNITGLSFLGPELSGKQLELLKEAFPKLSRVGVLWNPDGPRSALAWKESQLSARGLDLQLHSMEVRSPKDIEKAFEDATKARSAALAVTTNPLFTANRK